MPEIKDPVLKELDLLIAKHGSKQACAEAFGLYPSQFSDILHGRRNIPPKILEQLGYTRLTIHVKNDRVPAVVRAIEKAVAA